MQAAIDIKFACGSCGQRMLVDALDAGRTTNCPGCHSEVTVPILAAMDDPPYGGNGHAQMRPSMAEGSREGLVADGGSFTDVERLQNALERMEAANAHLQSELKHLHQDRQSLTTELNSLRQRLTAAETNLGASNRELSLAQGKLSRLEADLESAVTAREEFAGAHASIQWKVTELEAALKNADLDRARIAELADRLAVLKGQLSAVEKERDELLRECEQINSDLSSSENGRELAALREREKRVQEEHRRVVVALQDATHEKAALEVSYGRMQVEVDELRRRCMDAERRAESLSNSELGRDNEILRGILARQKEELEQRFREIMKWRRARLALRLTYALFGLGGVAVAGFAVKVLRDAF